ncbi:hypothetical protein [Nocardioides sp.]|uniref:hypothetical protein n=1 Tax=Nocardioides sp. TaxID=35761 RepID=UPI002ED82A1E
MSATHPRLENHAPAALHRRLTAIGLAGSALLVGAASLIAPANTGGPEELYTIGTESAARMTAEAYLLTLSSVLLVFGVIGAARLATGRGRLAARIAAGLGVLGALGHVAYSVFSLIALALVDSDLPRATVITALEAIDASAGVGLMVLPLILAYALSVLVLPIALHRAGLVRLWVVGLAAAAVLVEVVVPGTSVLTNAKYLFAFVAMAAIAVRILQLDDEQWRDPALAGVQRSRSASSTSDRGARSGALK